MTKRVGLDLILPVASLLPLERRVQWSEKIEIPRKVLDTLADGAETLAAVLIGWKVRRLSRSSWPRCPGSAPSPARPRSPLCRGRQDGWVAAQGDQRAGPGATRLPDGDADAVQVGPRPRRADRRLIRSPSASRSRPTRAAHLGHSRALLGVPVPPRRRAVRPTPGLRTRFADLEDEPTACHRAAGTVALRFPDPLGRRDASGRVIPHEFVVFGDLADEIESVEDGLRLVWPLVAEAYARVWDAEVPPSPDDLGFTT